MNVFVVLFAIAVVTTRGEIAALRARSSSPITPHTILWGETLLYPIGIWFVLCRRTARVLCTESQLPSIGWQARSPFEYELGWIEIPAWGRPRIASLLARLRSSSLASTIVISPRLGLRRPLPGTSGK